MNEVIMMPQQVQVSLIDNIDIKTVQNTMLKIANFQAIVQQTLKKDHDFGIIPGTNKATLLKPGGEKICMLLGLNPEYEFLSKEANYDKGIFNYEMKCTLKKSGSNVAQGVGSCNSYEKKYRWINSDTIPTGIDPTAVEMFTDKYGRTKYKIPNPNICDLANTILKMAKKRAFIDAVLQVSSLSDIFTQDIEEMQGFMQQEHQVAASTMTAQEAGALKVNFGKYKGSTLKEIYVQDKNYFSWLQSNDKTDQVIKQACAVMLKAAAKPNTQEQAVQAVQAEPIDNTPPADMYFSQAEMEADDDPF